MRFDGLKFRVSCFHQQKQLLRRADACFNPCHIHLSSPCLFSGAEATHQFVPDLSACMAASNKLVGGHVFLTFCSVHSCSPVMYYAAHKLPVSVSDSLHLYSTGMPNIPQTFAIKTERHSVFLLFWFSEWYGTASHTLACMQERGHMHICLFPCRVFLSSTTGPVTMQECIPGPFLFWFFLYSIAWPVSQWCVCRSVGTCTLMTLSSTLISSR